MNFDLCVPRMPLPHHPSPCSPPQPLRISEPCLPAGTRLPISTELWALEHSLLIVFFCRCTFSKGFTESEAGGLGGYRKGCPSRGSEPPPECLACRPSSRKPEGDICRLRGTVNPAGCSLHLWSSFSCIPLPGRPSRCFEETSWVEQAH